MDVLEKLRHAIKGQEHRIMAEIDPAIILAAIAEIERLHVGLTALGAISPGPSFQEIRETTPKVLKAFDGA